MYKFQLPKVSNFSSEDVKNIPSPMTIKDFMRKKKTELFASVSSLKNYNRSVNFNNPYYHLLQKIRKIHPNASNAWMKLYEILSVFPELTDMDEIKAFHLAELPGSFILATGTFCESINKHYTWIANSYIGDKTDGAYLDDTYNMRRDYPHKWYDGVSRTGDLCLVDNIRSFKQDITGINLITGDAKMVIDNNYDTEEDDNMAVITGEVLTAITVLCMKGNAVIKFFTWFNYQMQYLLYILSYHFDTVYMYKPYTSRPANDEIYAVCIRKCKRLNYDFLQKILIDQNILSYLPITKIPSEFITAVSNAQQELCDRQCKALELETSGIQRDIDLNIATEWCKLVKITL